MLSHRYVFHSPDPVVALFSQFHSLAIYREVGLFCLFRNPFLSRVFSRERRNHRKCGRVKTAGSVLARPISGSRNRRRSIRRQSLPRSRGRARPMTLRRRTRSSRPGPWSSSIRRPGKPGRCPARRTGSEARTSQSSSRTDTRRWACQSKILSANTLAGLSRCELG